MPAGDLISADYQAELNGLLMGTGTEIQFGEGAIGGLGVPQVKTSDSPYDGQDGSAGAPDFLDVRVVTLPLLVVPASRDPGDAGLLWTGIELAWAPARDGVNVELHFQLPGWGHLFLIGRARGATLDASDLKSGVLEALCRFDALDPTLYDFGS